MNLPPVANLIFTTLCRYVLGGVFLYAAYEKIIHPEAFALDVSHYRLLPDMFIYPVALFLPALELVAGVLIVAGPVKGEAAAWVGLMLLGFLFGESQALFRGLDISCGCFGSGSGKVNWISILRNTVLLLLSIWVVTHEAHKRRAKATIHP